MSAFYKKTILLSVIYLGLFAALSVLLFLPSYTKLNKNKKIFAQKQTEFSTKVEDLSTLQKFSKNKDDFQNVVKTVEKYFPETLNSSQFIVETEGLAKNLGITIEGFSMNDISTGSSQSGSKKEDKKKSPETQFSLNGTAPYPKVLEFIVQMEKLSRFNALSALNITSGEDTVNFQITGSIYYGQ